MFRDVLDFVRQVLALTQATEQNKLEIKELRQELEQLTQAVRNLAFEIRQMKGDERHEREKLLLRLENELLKFDRRLPRRDEDESG